MAQFREHLSVPGLLKTVRKSFERVKDPRRAGSVQVPMVDTLMSGVAIFGMKYSSLLQFDADRADPVVCSNLKNLYSVDQAPSDTQLREILDRVDPGDLRGAFKAVFAKVQDGKALAPYRYIGDSYLVSIDATGYFSSHEVHCDNCCVKESQSGLKTYYHQMLSAVVVHPDQKQVLPLVPEPILKQDGASKNDCELNATKRLLPALRNDHPFLSMTLLGDGLFSRAPTIKLAKSLEMRFIFGAKPGDHESLFMYLEDAESIGASGSIEKTTGNTTHKFRFVNDVPLNEANPDLLVNFLVYTETRGNKATTFSWVTDIPLSEGNIFQIMRGGRARWRIENETFNTLKNQGYNFEHNFGHGYKNLSTVFSYLMLLAFLVDQVQELCCPVFKEIVKIAKRRRYMWEKIRSFFLVIVIETWEYLFLAIRQRFEGKLAHNSS